MLPVGVADDEVGLDGGGADVNGSLEEPEEGDGEYAEEDYCVGSSVEDSAVVLGYADGEAGVPGCADERDVVAPCEEGPRCVPESVDAGG